jgi:hypothetical protein
MDSHGPAWCRENLETIVDWLMEPARARLLLGALVRIAPDAAREFARNLVLQAIELSEAAPPSPLPSPVSGLQPPACS